MLTEYLLYGIIMDERFTLLFISLFVDYKSSCNVLCRHQARLL